MCVYHKIEQIRHTKQFNFLWYQDKCRSWKTCYLAKVESILGCRQRAEQMWKSINETNRSFGRSKERKKAEDLLYKKVGKPNAILVMPIIIYLDEFLYLFVFLLTAEQSIESLTYLRLLSLLYALSMTYPQNAFVLDLCFM